MKQAVCGCIKNFFIVPVFLEMSTTETVARLYVNFIKT